MGRWVRFWSHCYTTIYVLNWQKCLWLLTKGHYIYSYTFYVLLQIRKLKRCFSFSRQTLFYRIDSRRWFTIPLWSYHPGRRKNEGTPSNWAQSGCSPKCVCVCVREREREREWERESECVSLKSKWRANILHVVQNISTMIKLIE